jgi:hypothetical protein
VSTATAVRPPEDPISQTALNCYLTTVIAVAECLAGVCPEIGIPYQERLMRVPRRLGFHATARSLEESRLALVSDLKEFGDITGRHFADMPRKAGEIVSLIARLSNIVGERNERHNAALGRLAEQMQFAAELDDAVRLRQMAAQQSIGLRASSETLEREIADLLGEITREARDLETRIRQPEAFSAMDRLTGLLNRLGMERQLNLCLERPNPFCVLVFAWIPDPRIEPAEREQMTPDRAQSHGTLRAQNPGRRRAPRNNREREHRRTRAPRNRARALQPHRSRARRRITRQLRLEQNPGR